MACGKCGCEKCGCGACECRSCSKAKFKLCPVSLGLAIGITSLLAVLIWSMWVMHNGLTPMMVARQMPIPTWGNTWAHAGLALVKGFVFGFVVAVIYDLCACCVKGMCHKKASCTCSCCASGSTPSMK